MKFFPQLVCNGIAGHVLGRMQYITCPLRNLSRNTFGQIGVTQCSFFLQLVSQHWKKKYIASCRRHVTRCNLELQLAMITKQSMLLLQKVELRSTLKKIGRQVAKMACYMLQPTCNLSRNTIAAQVAKLKRTVLLFAVVAENS